MNIHQFMLLQSVFPFPKEYPLYYFYTASNNLTLIEHQNYAVSK
jgi:hypothetical protein